jgi:Methane oxygenase PmoA
MLLIKHFAAVLLATAIMPFGLAAQGVEIKPQQGRIEVQIDGKPFTALYEGEEAHKPFVYPLLTASGKRVTRGFPVEKIAGDPEDRPHQRGLWIGCEKLSGMDFWENDPSYHRPRMGRIVFKDVKGIRNGTTEGSFTMLADWVSPEGETVLSETRGMTFYAGPAGSRMFDIDLHLKAKRDVTFEDHDDSIIGIRLGPAFDEKNGGKAVNAEGCKGEAGVRGQRSRYVDWQTDLDGERVGIALMDHPSNFSYPTRWHVRSNGLLVACPFAQHEFSASAPDGSKSLKTGEELHLRYRIFIHPVTANVQKIFEEFAAR